MAGEARGCTDGMLPLVASCVPHVVWNINESHYSDCSTARFGKSFADFFTAPGFWCSAHLWLAPEAGSPLRLTRLSNFSNNATKKKRKMISRLVRALQYRLLLAQLTNNRTQKVTESFPRYRRRLHGPPVFHVFGHDRYGSYCLFMF